MSGGGILHLGLGAFHRAHQAALTQDAGGGWWIEAVAMRNPALARNLNAQGGRFALIEQHPDGPRLHQISVIRRAHVLPEDPQAVIDRVADPEVHVVTITVTEKGYGADLGTRRLDPDDPVVAHDMANPGTPRGVVGVLLAGLAARRAAGGTGLTLISCDNLSDNGGFLRAVLCDAAMRRDPALARWIEDTCTFPSCMVDRITPAPTEATRAIARARGGRDDRAAVETEPFRQWVIEDAFAGPRPPWETAGVLIVPDVAPFELAKLRLLNGAHSMIAYLGALEGLPAVRDVMARADLRALTRAHMQAVRPTLPDLPGLDLDRYCDDLIARFANPAIDHRCLQIAMDGSQKMPQRVFAPALDLVEAGQMPITCALATAAWLAFLSSGAHPIDDPMADTLAALVTDADCDPEALVPSVGEGLGPLAAALWSQPAWTGAVARLLQDLRDHGVTATVSGVMRADQPV